MKATTDLDAFGPQLQGSFDFTLYFEQAILSILPSALLLVISPWRIAWLFQKRSLLRSGWHFRAKLVTATVYFVLQVALLALWALPATQKTPASLAAAVLALMDSVIIIGLVYAEHKHSIRPSKLLGIYLFASGLVDLAQARSLVAQRPLTITPIAGVFIAALVLKFVLLLLEEIPKDEGTHEKAPAESTSGPFNRAGYLAPVIPRICLAAFSFSQPFLVNRVTEFVGQPKVEQTDDIAGGLIGAALLVYLGLAISRCIYNHSVYQLTTTLRGGLVSLIFRKSLELDAAAASKTNAVTLMSTDIDSIASGVKELHEIWASVLELGVAIYLLYLQIGPACFVVIIPAVERATGGIGPARMQWNEGVQERVSTTSSMLSQMKGIKMTGLTDYFAKLVQKLRVSELDMSKKFRMYIVRIILIANFSDQMTPAVVVTAAVFWTRADGFSISQAFTSLAIVALVSTPLANLIGSYPTFVSSLGCFGRIQKFLLQSDGRAATYELSANNSGEKPSSSTASVIQTAPQTAREGVTVELEDFSAKGSSKNSNVCIKFEAVSVAVEGKAEPILRDITLSLETSSYTLIVGPVGCGKSTFLKAVLGEVAVTNGHVHVEQAGYSVAFCDQSPWLRNISVKANILGRDQFDHLWFDSVIRACALEEDFSRFPNGEETVVGSGGIMLSGGQKQRVALARALYARKLIVILDDVFSALDSATSKTVFERTLGPRGLLRQGDTTVILATHSAFYLRAETMLVQYISSADKVVVLSKQGSLEKYGTVAELQAENGFIRCLQLSQPTSTSTAVEDGEVTESGESSPSTPSSSKTTEEEASLRQTGDFSLYRYYLASIGPNLAVPFLVLATLYIGFGTMPSVWLRIWTERGTDASDRGAYFGVYWVWCIGTVIFSGLVVWLFFVVIIAHSASRLHWQLLDSVLKAPLLFFTTVDSGVTLNRFSQDMTLVDQQLPVAFFEVVLDTLTAIASAGIIASGAQYFAVVIPFCVVPLYALQKFYLRTSRQVRHLDLELKSPLYTHFTETLNGIVTIRAFGWQREFVADQFRLLDLSQKPYYLLFCIQRWLSVVLDLFVTVIATILVALAVKVTHTTSSGAIGLSMVSLISLNTALSRIITAWTNLETSLGAISRLRDFVRDTPQEEDADAKYLPAVPQGWPAAGEIEFSHLDATYKMPDEKVLEDLSLTIEPGQKVGICGRTGSGKTSLLLALLRLLDTPSGTIRVDNIDLSSHSRKAIRPHLITLPQDPVHLPGTVRTNLDPHGLFGRPSGDTDLIAALGKVFLWDDVISPRGGLDADFSELGLSHGQEQLFGLARALLHKDESSIVLLDEATSSVDYETDRRVQEVIREGLARHTVLAVAHRLDTIRDYDLVVVMERGRIVEKGDPRELREQEGSAFRRLLVHAD
ncbi:hypothetical protein VPNG_06410 [Cytospora leucostoma]|uniref:Uncharacterized protein n=1 Tax=Cytospora leucostoma TaxID=1230097 RepID=A0A423WZ11_9PEZI|nr:hypothetical protein VPNG_06410 [Cytospora leucostoma]